MTQLQPPRLGRDLAHLLGWPALGIAAALLWFRPWAIPAFDTGLRSGAPTVVAGVWDWTDADSTCVANPHLIQFDPDLGQMQLIHRRPWTDSTGAEHRVAVYDVYEHTDSRVRAALQGETRVTDAGAPVVWDLVLTSRDTYVWHRTDWASYARTNEVSRCPDGTDSLIAPP